MIWNGIRKRVRSTFASVTLLFCISALAPAGAANGQEAVVGTEALPLRVLSYNIQGLPLPKIDHTRYRKIGVRLRALRATGQGFHVVVLQEAFHKRTRELIEEAGYPYLSYGPRGKGLRTNSGLAILSEFPIVDEEQMVYRFCSGIDCISRKGVQLARVDVPGVGIVNFCNTHMNASYDDGQWPPDAIGDIPRMRQLTQMREFFHETGGTAGLTVFGGDFNFRSTEPTYAFFSRFSGLSNAAEDCGRDLCPGEPDPLKLWEGAIDHQFYTPAGGDVRITPVLFRRNFRELVGGKTLSDHLGHEVHYVVER